MSFHSSSQIGMNHLNRLTDISASLYNLIFSLFWLGRENAYRQRILKLMNIAGDESVLDVGCGTGTLVSMIARRIAGRGCIFGIDLSPRMIEIARKKARKQGNHVEYRVATSLALPFDNETFDVVVTSLVYHQLFSWEEKIKTLSEIGRVLRPEGRYVAAEFTRFTPGNLLITHDSLIRRIPLFGPELLEESGFYIKDKVKTVKGIAFTSARKEAREQEVLSDSIS